MLRDYDRKKIKAATETNITPDKWNTLGKEAYVGARFVMQVKKKKLKHEGRGTDIR